MKKTIMSLIEIEEELHQIIKKLGKRANVEIPEILPPIRRIYPKYECIWMDFSPWSCSFGINEELLKIYTTHNRFVTSILAEEASHYLRWLACEDREVEDYDIFMMIEEFFGALGSILLGYEEEVRKRVEIYEESIQKIEDPYRKRFEMVSRGYLIALEKGVQILSEKPNLYYLPSKEILTHLFKSCENVKVKRRVDGR